MDRWGRRLMKRREELRAKRNDEKPKKLLESDFLLGVYDEARMGGLRFKTDIDGEFLSNDAEFATPPWTSLRELEQASIAFESDENGLNEKWLKQLLAPGSSLGGARPKASVKAPDGSLWIAKYFSSAMTMLGKNDGANATDGSSYLEIASFLKANGAEPKRDLQELWKRIVFNMAVSNTDDHFRNHGFILKDAGWGLSPLYDVNPDIYGEYLSLNVDDSDSSIEFDLAVDAAPYYGIEKDLAVEIVDNVKCIVMENWQETAKKYGISRGEIERMRPAFNI